MSGLNKFKSKLAADKKLQKKMGEASTVKDVVQIAADVGCSVSEQEVRDDMIASISGGDVGSAGLGLGGLLGSNGDLNVGDVNLGVNLLDFSNMTANISQHLDGATNSNAVQSGNINVSKGH